LDAQSATGLDGNQLLGLELPQRFTHGRFTYAELLCEVVRTQPRARRKRIGHDRLAQHRVSGIGGIAGLAEFLEDPVERHRHAASRPSMGWLTLRLGAPAVGHHIDLPPAPPATITIRSCGWQTTGTDALSSRRSTQTGKNGPFDLPRSFANFQGRRAPSKRAI